MILMLPPNESYPTAARTLLATARHGVLSTLSVSADGYPFGSLTPYLIDDAGRITIYISFIAEHYRNLAQDPRASLLVADPFGDFDPQAHARATVLLRFAPIPESEVPAITQAYEARFPASINYAIAHNFTFMRGEVTQVRWIGGFGAIAWIDKESFGQACPDPLAATALEIVNHMNADHRDALVDIVRGLSSHDPEGKQVTLVGISSAGLSLRLKDHTESYAVTIPFPAPIAPADARGAVIRLLREARNHLARA
jgi:putative heme iron utilization protein